MFSNFLTTDNIAGKQLCHYETFMLPLLRSSLSYSGMLCFNKLSLWSTVRCEVHADSIAFNSSVLEAWLQTLCGCLFPLGPPRPSATKVPPPQVAAPCLQHLPMAVPFQRVCLRALPFFLKEFLAALTLSSPLPPCFPYDSSPSLIFSCASCLLPQNDAGRTICFLHPS